MTQGMSKYKESIDSARLSLLLKIFAFYKQRARGQNQEQRDDFLNEQQRYQSGHLFHSIILQRDTAPRKDAEGTPSASSPTICRFPQSMSLLHYIHSSNKTQARSVTDFGILYIRREEQCRERPEFVIGSHCKLRSVFDELRVLCPLRAPILC